jgi:hypothetical protein
VAEGGTGGTAQALRLPGGLYRNPCPLSVLPIHTPDSGSRRVKVQRFCLEMTMYFSRSFWKKLFYAKTTDAPISSQECWFQIHMKGSTAILKQT